MERTRSLSFARPAVVNSATTSSWHPEGRKGVLVLDLGAGGLSLGPAGTSTYCRGMSPRRAVVAALAVVGLAAVTGCGAQPAPAPAPAVSSTVPASPSSTASASTASPTPTPTPTASPTPTPSPTATPPPVPRFDADAVLADVRRLASDIGPREATSRNFRRAADLVDDRFASLGYRVRRTTVRVPAGNSWGTPVRRGTSQNVIAEPAGFDPRQPHRLVVAHLDTIPVAPGGEDNASGVSVMLELARMAAAQRPALPTRFIAFGAEEPRGPGDALHHFGSQQLVADTPRAERRAIDGVISLDRVGVRASYVPVCRTPLGGQGLRRDVRAAARRVDVPTQACENTTSDHWSYAKADVPAIRLGGIEYDEYHSRRDTFRVVDRRQLDRVGRTAWSWLRSPR